MRTYPPSFTYANRASEKSPRFAVSIDFDSNPLWLTSHPSISGIDGELIGNVLTVRDARSQRIFPDEGRSEIGVVNFDLLDIGAAITEAFRDRNQNHIGLRGKKVTLYHGWAGADFSQYQVFQTQVVQSVSYDKGVYRFRCADITREQRKDVFDQKSTRLSASIDAAAVTVEVVTTSAFELVEHGDSWSDAANETVGYIQIEDEVIRYTGKTSTTFTGCTRGVLNTRAAVHTVDLNAPQDRRTEVKERIYLELPAPKLIVAVMTGELYGQTASLPRHWHLGIDPVWVRTADFLGIGTDLWDTTNENLSFTPVFTNLKKTDGKRFLEAEVYQLIGCFPLVYSDGTVGIRRMNRILADAPFNGVLNHTNVVSWSEATYDMEALCNDYQVQWNFDDDGNPTRITRLVDANSINQHGEAPQRALKFSGLYGGRHTDSTVRQRLDSLRDRYAHPPLIQTVRVLSYLNVMEVGDVMRNRLPLVRDFMGEGDSIDRSMEIQSTSINIATGEVELQLFGSTGLSSTEPPSGAGGEGPAGENVLPDGWYTSRGTPLSSVVDMTLVGDVWVTDPGTFAVPGNASLDNDGAIYYHLGDLTFSDDTILNISQNVQLRLGGFTQINGKFDGIGEGRPGVSDTTDFGTSAFGSPGFGTTRAMDGVDQNLRPSQGGLFFSTLAARVTRGTMDQVPFYELRVTGASEVSVEGLPIDLRGTGGGPGGKAQSHIGSGSKNVFSVGGPGAAGGAGLMIICRGAAFGASGEINLSGVDSTPTSPVGGEIEILAGAGAPGAPGALLMLLDGPLLSLPSLSGGKFLAITGASAAPRLNNLLTPSGGVGTGAFPLGRAEPGEGYLDPGTTDLQDMSNSAYRIQYIPAKEAAVVDQPAGVPPPTNLGAASIAGGILLTYNLPDFSLFDSVEIWRSLSNDRSLGLLQAENKATSFTHYLATSSTRYYWVRTRRGDQYSEWEPASPTGGVTATAG